jgi:isopentenyldiphosphate isomerase
MNNQADKNDELIDVLDENGVKTGRQATRGQVHTDGSWHRIVAVAIVDDENRLLIQQRSDEKAKNPGKWDISAAGHVAAGQDSLAAATREIAEEVAVDVGFNVDVKDFRFMTSFRQADSFGDKQDNQFYDFFIFRKHGLNVEGIRFQESEVQAIKAVSLSEFIRLVESGEVVPRPAIHEAIINHLTRF